MPVQPFYYFSRDRGTYTSLSVLVDIGLEANVYSE